MMFHSSKGSDEMGSSHRFKYGISQLDSDWPSLTQRTSDHGVDEHRHVAVAFANFLLMSKSCSHKSICGDVERLGDG